MERIEVISKSLSSIAVTMEQMSDKLSRSIIRIALKFPKNRITSKIVHTLLDHTKEGAIATRQGFLIHFKFTGGKATNLRKAAISGNYESDYLAIMQKLIKPGDCAVDIGAHEGYISLLMSRLVGEAGRVFSIEPNKENVEFLKLNINHNAVRNIVVVEKGISDQNSKQLFYYNDDEGAWGGLIHFSHEGCKKAVEIDVECLDNILDELEPFVQQIKFLKIDAEGSELNVFRGARKVLTEHKPHICFEVSLTYWALMDSPVDMMFELLRDYGYELFVLKSRKLHPYKWLDERVMNMFAIHQGRKAELMGKEVFDGWA